jgi:hypothetical protein
LCVGDFNEILEYSEKYGERRTPQSQMRAFQKVLNSCELKDLGYIGACFTWNNLREGLEHIRERLDRALGNKAWKDLFLVRMVEILPSCTFDHTPILILFQRHTQTLGLKKKCFRYKVEWGRDRQQKEVIKKVWRVKKMHENEWQGV